MRYINQLQLIQTVMEGKPPNSKELLADVDHDAVLRALERSRDGVPETVTFTNMPMEEENLAKMPRRQKRRFQKIIESVNDNPRQAIADLLKLRQKYPNVPAIQNYLGTAYLYSGREDLHHETLLETVERFPSYLFGKTALSEYYLNRQQHQKVKEIFEGKFELRLHYPTRTIFHVSEVRSFFYVIGSYSARTNNLSRALHHYCILADAEPDHLVTKRLGDEIVRKEIEKLSRRLSRNTGRRS